MDRLSDSWYNATMKDYFDSEEWDRMVWLSRLDSVKRNSDTRDWWQTTILWVFCSILAGFLAGAVIVNALYDYWFLMVPRR